MDRNRLLFGGVLLTLGVLFLLDTADVLDAGALIADWWPLVIVAAGLLALIPPVGHTGAAGAWITIFVGLALLAATLGLLQVSIFAVLWPLLLIAVGVAVLLNRSAAAHVGAGRDLVAVFAGRRLVSTDRPFRGASALAIFGGVEIDLTGAELPSEGATIAATALFGGVDITVPHDWRVDLTGPAIFGGNVDKTVDTPVFPLDAPVLTVNAFSAFGGTDIKRGVRPLTPALH